MAARRSERFGIVLGAVDKVSAPIRAMNRSLESAVAPVKKLNRAFSALSKEAGFGKLGAGFGRVGREIAKIGAIGAGAAGGLFVALERTAAPLDKLAKLTSRIQFPVEEFQEWRAVAGLAGTSSDEFDKSLEGLSKRVGELKAGTGSLSTLLAKVDPGLAKRISGAKDTQEAFGLVLGAIRELPDASKQAALANAAFGRSGAKLINLAKQSSEAIAAQRESVRDGVVSAEAIKNAEQFDDSVGLLKGSLGALWSEIAGKLFPIVTKISDSIRVWVGENRELIVTNVSEFIGDAITAGEEFFKTLTTVIPAVISMVSHIGGLKTILIVLGAVALAPLVLAIAALGPLLMGTAGIVLLVGTAFALAAAEVIDNWEMLKAFVGGTIDWIADSFASLSDSIPEPVKMLLGLTPIGLAVRGIGAAADFFSGGAEPALAGAGAAGGSVPLPEGRAAQRAQLEGKLTVRVDQSGRVDSVELDSPAALDLEQGGIIGQGL
jgi:hypothetical protein